MTTSMTLFCQLLALGRAPNKDRDRSIRSQLNSRCQLVSLLSLFIAIYIAKTKALLPTVLVSAKCLLQFSQFDNTFRMNSREVGEQYFFANCLIISVRNREMCTKIS